MERSKTGEMITAAVVIAGALVLFAWLAGFPWMYLP